MERKEMRKEAGIIKGKKFSEQSYKENYKLM